ncbi:hypothetical protein QWY20_09305 [Alkalimonas sp. MEB108]|uniref:Uncharacterized protein n=1 Tax=Alkalimonas cellulosilytica TaxID=3058395 RepID=A0ABU7J565_9GAMM|nr:hypothetical protein [Alkalimonas sp. MEB108]MEE2001648.1 hypothetical protein [Alkalimonas sp. MEB108]
MKSTNKMRKEYGSTRRRIVVCADQQTERFILEAQTRLSELTGMTPSLSVAIAYLVKEGHKAAVNNR